MLNLSGRYSLYINIHYDILPFWFTTKNSPTTYGLDSLRRLVHIVAFLMAPPKKRALPKPLPEGFILTDTEKKKWRLGKIIGQGGFGLIYLASQDVDRPVSANTDFVIKVEYHENGPLFSELKFYQRAAKPASMEKWKRSRELDFLGIPTYWGSGLAEYNDLKYRFMAMDRLGSDLQKVCEKNRGRLKKTTVLQLGQRLVTVLEYIHENEYVHADIKAANLMVGYRDPEQVYLADYGLSYRYCPDGVHKPYIENPKKGHNGTIEYTSIDAHKGLAPSRRGDLQILGFCLLHWLCGSLPWDNVLKNPAQVQEAKTRLMDNLPDSVQQLSVSGASTDEVAAFLLYVKTLDYQEKPDYQYLKVVLASVVTEGLDLPTGIAELSASKVQEPPTREKKLGRGRGSSKGKALPTVLDDEQEKERMKSKPVQGCYIKGPSLTKHHSETREKRSLRPTPAPVVTVEEDDSDDDDDDEEETEEEEEEVADDNTRPRPISKRFLRGPPTGPRAQPEQKEERVSPATRSLRPRPDPVVTYKEDDSEDDDDDEEVVDDNTRPRPISKRYLRGPPTGPRTQPKQKTKPKGTGKKKDDLTVTSERQKRRLHLQRREHILTNHMEYREKWDQVQLHHKAGYRHQWQDCVLSHENTDSFGELKRSVLRRPEEEAIPNHRNGLFSWLVFGCATLFLGTLLGVCQSNFKPF